MKLTEILSPEALIPQIQATHKEEVLYELSAHLCTLFPQLQPQTDDIYQALLEREQVSSTGVGDGLAIPHARLSGLSTFLGVLGISRTGIDFQALDHQPISVFVVLLTPEHAHREHLTTLARICRLFKGSTLSQALRAQFSAEDMFVQLQNVEQALYPSP